MKPLILFYSKSGATKECVEILSKRLHCSTCNLAKYNPTMNLVEFDTIIIGTGVRMGKIYKPMKQFIARNLDILITKNTAVFFCNAYLGTFQKAVEKNLPAQLIKHSICLKSFGGKPPFSNPQNMDWLHSENLKEFIHEVEKSR